MNTASNKPVELARKQCEAYWNHIEREQYMGRQVFDIFHQILDKVLEKDSGLKNLFIRSVQSAATHRKLTTGGMSQIIENFAYLIVEEDE